MVLAYDEVHAPRLSVHVDPVRPHAWQKEPYYSQIKRWAIAAAALRGRVRYASQKAASSTLLPSLGLPASGGPSADGGGGGSGIASAYTGSCDAGIDCVDNRFPGRQPYPRTRLAKKKDEAPPHDWRPALLARARS